MSIHGGLLLEQEINQPNGSCLLIRQVRPVVFGELLAVFTELIPDPLNRAFFFLTFILILLVRGFNLKRNGGSLVIIRLVFTVTASRTTQGGHATRYRIVVLISHGVFLLIRTSQHPLLVGQHVINASANGVHVTVVSLHQTAKHSIFFVRWSWCISGHARPVA